MFFTKFKVSIINEE